MKQISELINSKNFVQPTESDTKQFLDGLRKNVQNASVSNSFMPTIVSPSQTTNAQSNEDLVLFLWVTMGEIYGNLWTNSFGDEPNKQWTLEISKLTKREVIYGIEMCKRSESEFVPPLPKFLAYCKAGKRFLEEETLKLLVLPKPPKNPEIKKTELDKMLGRKI